MNLHITKIGEALSGPSGIAELMQELGAALQQDASEMLMLGGGNPAHVPEMQAVWRRRLQEIVADPPFCDRLLANYDGPAGSPRFRQAMAACLRETYGWDVGPENIAVTAGGQTAFFFFSPSWRESSLTDGDEESCCPYRRSTSDTPTKGFARVP